MWCCYVHVLLNCFAVEVFCCWTVLLLDCFAVELVSCDASGDGSEKTKTTLRWAARSNGESARSTRLCTRWRSAGVERLCHAWPDLGEAWPSPRLGGGRRWPAAVRLLPRVVVRGRVRRHVAQAVREEVALEGGLLGDGAVRRQLGAARGVRPRRRVAVVSPVAAGPPVATAARLSVLRRQSRRTGPRRARLAVGRPRPLRPRPPRLWHRRTRPLRLWARWTWPSWNRPCWTRPCQPWPPLTRPPWTRPPRTRPPRTRSGWTRPPWTRPPWTRPPWTRPSRPRPPWTWPRRTRPCWTWPRGTRLPVDGPRPRRTRTRRTRSRPRPWPRPDRRRRHWASPCRARLRRPAVGGTRQVRAGPVGAGTGGAGPCDACLHPRADRRQTVAVVARGRPLRWRRLLRRRHARRLARRQRQHARMLVVQAGGHAVRSAHRRAADAARHQRHLAAEHRLLETADLTLHLLALVHHVAEITHLEGTELLQHADAHTHTHAAHASSTASARHGL